MSILINIAQQYLTAEQASLFEQNIHGFVEYDNTYRTYRDRISHAVKVLGYLPIDNQGLIDLVNAMYQQEYKPSSIDVTIHGVKWMLENAGVNIDKSNANALKRLLRTIKQRSAGVQMKGGRILSTEDKRKIFELIQHEVDKYRLEYVDAQKHLDSLTAAGAKKVDLIKAQNAVNRIFTSLAVHARDLAFLLTAMYSSQRVETLCNMRFEDMIREDTQEGVKWHFRLRVMKTDKTGDGSGTGWMLETSDIEPIFSLDRAMQQWIEVLRVQSGYVFRDCAGIQSMQKDKCVGVRAMQSRFSYYIGSIDITGVSLHAFRASFVTHGLDSNIPEAQLMAMTTHKNPETLLKHYYKANIRHPVNIKDVI
jgi:integrase